MTLIDGHDYLVCFVEAYKCETCGKGFRTEAYLKQHMLIHATKMHKCNVCSAAFPRRDHLTRHKLSHDPVKKFKCPFKKFTGTLKFTCTVLYIFKILSLA